MVSIFSGTSTPQIVLPANVTTPELHGAVGDGVTDDSVAIQAAIDAVYALGGGSVFCGKTYLCIDIELKSNVTVVNTGGARFIKNGGVDNSYVFFGAGTLGLATTVTSPVTLGTSSFTVSSVIDFAENTWAILRDDTYVSGAAGRNQEIVKIEDITLSTITLQGRTLAAYSGVIELVPLTPIENVNVFDCEMFIAQVAGGNVGGGIFLQYGVNCRVLHNSVDGNGGDAAVTFKTCYASHANFNTLENGQNTSAGGFGYGIEFDEATHNCVAAYNVTRNIRENTFTNRTRFCVFENNHCTGSYDTGFNTHGAGVTDCSVSRNVISGTKVGYGIAVGHTTLSGPDRNITITDNILNNIASTGIIVTGNVTHRNYGIVITGNTIYNVGVASTATGISVTRSDKCRVRNNTISGVTTLAANGVYFSNCDDFVASNNGIQDFPNGYGCTVDNSTNGTIRDNDFSDVSSYNIRELNTCSNIRAINNVSDTTFVQLLGGVIGHGNSWDTLSGNASFDPISLADGAGETTTIVVTGAALGDFVQAAFSLNTSGILISSWVSSANTVSVRLQNESGGVLDIAAGTLRVRVEKV